jgi:hypothetical protein
MVFSDILRKPFYIKRLVFSEFLKISTGKINIISQMKGLCKEKMAGKNHQYNICRNKKRHPGISEAAVNEKRV